MNIQAVARRTGVPAATLRKWEQRYGVLRPERTEGRHRRYSERDVLRVEWLRDRLAEGYRIGEAASMIGGETELTPSSEPEDLVEELIKAATVPDPVRISRTLELAFTQLGSAPAIETVVAPALEHAGELWADGELEVAQEHHLTAQVLGKLRALLDGTLGGPRGTAVVCTVPGERHEVGVSALAVLLAADGWRVVYLGPDTPLRGAAKVADAVGAKLLCVGATLREHAEAAGNELAALEWEYPHVTVVRGGAGFGDVHAAEAVEQLRALGG